MHVFHPVIKAIVKVNFEKANKLIIIMSQYYRDVSEEILKLKKKKTCYRFFTIISLRNVLPGGYFKKATKQCWSVLQIAPQIEKWQSFHFLSISLPSVNSFYFEWSLQGGLNSSMLLKQPVSFSFCLFLLFMWHLASWHLLVLLFLFIPKLCGF